MEVKELFDNDPKIGFIPIATLADWIVNQPIIGLPKFQRDAVWDHDRVEMLWDSLLRGFPIGSLILTEAGSIPPKPVPQSREAQSDSRYTETLKGQLTYKYLIIDGQQRSSAISLGFKSSEYARLWIDLTQKHDASEQKYRFYLCSKSQPWGSKATEEQRAKARAWLFLNNPDLLIDGSRREADWNLPIDRTWPAAADLPVPFDVFVKHCQADKTVSSDIEALIPEYFRAEENFDRYKQNKENTFTESLAKEINRGIKLSIPIQLVPRWSLSDVEGDESPECTAQALEKLFTRLNTQGVKMSAEDLFFSAIKTQIPDAHDLVWKIYSEHGKILAPSALVHMASRIVVANNKENLNLETVGPHTMSWLRKSGYTSFCEDFRSYVINEKIFNKVFAITNKLLSLDVPKDDLGFPIPLVAELPARCKRFMWHAIAGWVDYCLGKMNMNQEEILLQRTIILQYASIEAFFVGSDRAWASNEIFKKARGNKEFPIRGILEYYKNIKFFGQLPECEGGSGLHCFPSPDQYKKLLDGINEELLPLRYPRFLLLWSQRTFMRNWFPDYDPTSFVKSDEKPFDYDHILSQENSSPAKKQEEEESREKYLYWLNSIGNLRVWPKGENRRDQNKSVTYKLLLDENESSELSDGHPLRNCPCKFSTARDIWTTSLINNTESWRSVDSGNLDVFVHAVKERIVDMYSLWYNALKINTLSF